MSICIRPNGYHRDVVRGPAGHSARNKPVSKTEGPLVGHPGQHGFVHAFQQSVGAKYKNIAGHHLQRSAVKLKRVVDADSGSQPSGFVGMVLRDEEQLLLAQR